MFLGDYLKLAVEDCYSEHEPDLVAGMSRLTLSRIGKFGFRHMIIDRCLGKSGVRVLGQKLMQGKMTEQECFARIRETRQRYHDQISQSLIIESYSFWWLFARHLDSIWPHAKMAGVIRDPRTWIDSWKRHSPARRKHSSRDGLIQPLVTPGSLNDSRWSSRWSEIGQTGRLAWDWFMVYRELTEAADNSARVSIFRFEDLFTAGSPKMDSFVEFVTSHSNRHYRLVNRNILDRPPVNASEYTERSWQSWSPAEARIVDDICGSIMQLYGYGTEPEWRKLLAGEPG